MSKVKKCMLVAIALTVGFTFKATNVLAATLHQENTQYYYDRSRADGSDHHSWYWKHYTMSGDIAYCIEPNVPEGVNYSQGSYEATGLSDSIKERL